MTARSSKVEIKQVLEEVIDEMVAKGIYWSEAESQWSSEAAATRT